MNNGILVSILISLIVNEFLGLTDWLAYKMTLWAAERWKAQTGFDHLEEWLEDLEHAPGRLLKVVSSSWLLLGTFVSVEHMTLNLPSLWRLTRPLRSTLADMFRAAIGLIRGMQNRMKVRLASTFDLGFYLVLIKAATSLLPKRVQQRYSEEWMAELCEVPANARARWAVGLVLSAPRLAISMRLQSANP
jgi:hypothetical protein